MTAPLRDETGGRAQARDLRPEERALAGLFGALERHEAPRCVRRAIEAGANRGGPAARLLHAFPFGGWGIASAALVLLCLGAAVSIELAGSPAPGPSRAAGSRLQGMTIVEDGRLALYHDVETFDDVGRARGRLIADWGR